MIEESEAYKILGLADGVSKDEILKRYDTLMKKYKAGDIEKGTTIEEVDNAYNVLMGYDLKGRKDMKPGKLGFFTKLWAKVLNMDERKVENFIHYHKYHVLAVIVAIALLFSIVKGCVTRVDPDFYFTTIGEIYVADAEKTAEALKPLLPGIVAPQVDPLLLSDKDQGEQAYAMQMKAMTMMAAGDMDLMVLDLKNYKSYAAQGAFLKIDDMEQSLGIKLEKNEALKVTSQDAGEAIYGIDITNSKLMKDIGITGKQLIVAVRVNAKHEETAFKALRVILDVK